MQQIKVYNYCTFCGIYPKNPETNPYGLDWKLCRYHMELLEFCGYAGDFYEWKKKVVGFNGRLDRVSSKLSHIFRGNKNSKIPSTLRNTW